MSAGYQRESSQPPVVVQVPQQPGLLRSWLTRMMFSFLLLSLFLNFALLSSEADLDTGPLQEHVSGDELAVDSIAIIEISGTIMPPFTERIIDLVETARDDDDVKGVVLSIDSPGGLVADIDGSDNYMHSGNIVCGNPKCFKATLQVVKPLLG